MAAADTLSIVRPRPVSMTDLNRKVYLGLYDSRSWPEPDSRDEQRVRDYMVQKYENKRWYVAPTEAMKEEAKRANEAALNSKPQVKPLRSLLGENAPKLSVGTLPTATSHPHPHVSAPPGGFKSPPALNTPAAAPTSIAPPAKPTSGFDLLSDLGGDPFASNTTTANNHSDGGFADFSNFDSMSSAPSHPPAAAPSQVAPVPAAPQAFPVSNTPLQPLGRGQPSAPTPTTAPPPAAASFMSASDKYAALADLDSAFSAPTTTATSINWGGSEGGAIINWGGTSSAASTPSQSTAGVSWNTTTSGSGQINWNSQGSAGGGMGTTPPSSGFGAPAPANPFGGVATSGMPVFSSAAPTSSVNPFGAAAPASMPMSQFSQAPGMGAGGMPVSSGAGFGGQFAVPGQAAGFGQFPPMQNGGFGMTPTSAAAFGGSAAFSQQQPFMMSAQPGAMQQAGGWGQMGGVQPGVPSQPVANPFMNTAMHQQVPPPSGSTNPFL